MARDVEFNVTASDRTGMALAEAEKRFAKTNDKINRESKKTGDGLGKGLGDGITKAAPGMLSGLSGVFSKAGLASGPNLAAGLALAAPLIGGVIAGAVIGGVGIGGVIGGVALAARDAQVQAAGKRLGQTLMAGLDQDAAVFVEPTIAAIGKIEARFELMRPKLQGIFGNTVKFLDPLLDGVLNGVEGVLGGVERLTAKGGPVIDAFGRYFTETGYAVGEALDTIAGGSDDAATAIDGLSAVTTATIEAFAGTTRVLTETYGALVATGDAIQRFGEWIPNLDDLAGGTQRVGQSNEITGTFVQRTAGALQGQGAAAQTTGSAMATLTERINGVYAANRALFDSQTGAGAAFDNLTKSVKDNGRTLDVNTEKGRANRGALSNLAQALNTSYQAYVDVNGEGAKSNGVAASNYASFIKAARGLNISEAAAKAYATKLGLIPPKKATSFNANTHDAEARVKALQDKINGVKGKTVTITIKGALQNKAALGKLGPQVGLNYSAADHWAALNTTTGSGTARTGGPNPVSLTSEVSVSLDGRPFYNTSVRAAQQVAARQAWRQKVGPR